MNARFDNYQDVFTALCGCVLIGVGTESFLVGLGAIFLLMSMTLPPKKDSKTDT